MDALICSTNENFTPGDSMSRLRDILIESWRVSPARARDCDIAVAWYHGRPVAAFELRNVFRSDEVWSSTQPKRRTGLVLGEPVPLPAALLDLRVSLRNGVAVVTI